MKANVTHGSATLDVVSTYIPGKYVPTTEWVPGHYDYSTETKPGEVNGVTLELTIDEFKLVKAAVGAVMPSEAYAAAGVKSGLWQLYTAFMNVKLA
jgi:hypothetical protein